MGLGKIFKKTTHALKSVGKALLNVGTFGYVGQREQNKALQKQTDAEVAAAQMMADAEKKAAANTPEDQQEAVASAVRDEESKAIRRRRGMAGTVKTSALGTTGTVSSGSNKLGIMG